MAPGRLGSKTRSGLRCLSLPETGTPLYLEPHNQDPPKARTPGTATPTTRTPATRMPGTRTPHLTWSWVPSKDGGQRCLCLSVCLGKAFGKVRGSQAVDGDAGAAGAAITHSEPPCRPPAACTEAKGCWASRAAGSSEPDCSPSPSRAQPGVAFLFLLELMPLT